MKVKRKSNHHIYDYDVDLDSHSAAAHVVRMVGLNKRVLDVGAGPGSITKHLVSHNKCDVVALEIDHSCIPQLQEITKHVYSVDLNHPTWSESLDEEKFDVIVAADVLEHLQNPLCALKNMVSLLRPDGEIIISLPHVGHCTIGACLLAENFRYQDWGLLDRTHIQFFGLHNINDLHKDADLSIVEAQFVVKKPHETEFFDIWKSISSVGRKGLLTNPYGFVYQVVSRAQISTYNKNSINLMTLPVEGKSFSFKKSLCSILKNVFR